MTALVLAIGIHALYMLPLKFNRHRELPEPAGTAMLWIAAALEPRPPGRRSVPPRTSRRDAIASIPEQAPRSLSLSPVPEIPREPEAPQDTSVAVPWVDWQAQAAKAAADFVRRKEQERRESGSTEAQAAVRQPGRSSIARKAGQYERLQNGVEILWYTDLCYYEFDPAQGRKFRTVCKVRTEAERLSTDLADALEEEVKPEYLGGKRTLPALPDSPVQIP